jgi:glycerol-3-phosphate acyltransferase PlsY
MAVVVILAAYLIGSISFAVVVTRVMGLPDPRTFGSKNPGATNVLRSGRKSAAALTFFGDGFKGWLAVWLAQHLALTPALPAWVGPAAAVAVVLGHMFPVFFRFVGGKGVATALGAILALDLTLTLIAFAVWLVLVFTTRFVSLASMAAVAAATAACAWLYSPQQPLFASMVAIALLIIWRHRSNIQKLLAGTESRVGKAEG